MKWSLLISGIIEVIGGLIVFFAPYFIYEFEGLYHIAFKLYGFTMFILGIINVFAYFAYQVNKFFKQIFLSMMGFHGALAMLCYSAPEFQFPLHIQGAITHGVIFSIFLTAYLKEN